MMRFFTSDLRRNLIKILCLTAGLAIGFILVAKIYVEETFDTFYPDSDRVFILWESFVQNDEYKEYKRTSGAIAPGAKNYAPTVESATRFTDFLGADVDLTLDDGRQLGYEGVILADSCFFDVLTRPIVAGDPHTALAVPAHCMIPRSIAEKIGGNPVGMTFTIPSLSKEYTFTIGGVYEDFPINSSLENNIILSLAGIGDFTHDGRENWRGNDRYFSFVRLAKGAKPRDLEPYFDQMLKDNVGEEDVEKSGYAIKAHPYSDFHKEAGGASTILWMLSLLAILILFISSLNYLLIVLGQVNSRSKEMAIRKCYGTGRAKIFARIMGESIFFLAVSMVLAVLIVLAMSDTVTQLMGYTAEQLLSVGGVWWVEGAVCLLLLVITGVIPAWLYCRTPVVHVFRTNPRSRRLWKLAFLAVEFFASGAMICILSLIMRQYNLMAGSDRGYETENIAMLNAYMKRSERASLIEALKELPEVEGVSSSYSDITERSSGNNIWTSDPDITYNVADLYYVNPDLFDVMGIKFVQGHTFDENVDSTVNQIIVEERMIGVMQKYFNLQDDNLIDKTLFITEHWDGNTPIEFTICGVVENMQRGSYSEAGSDLRPAVMFPSQRAQSHLYIRFADMNPESLAVVQSLIKQRLPEFTGVLVPLGPYLDARYNSEVKNFGKLVMIAGLAILFIALLGLIGYTSDEVQRRTREIAIRKVNGTSTMKVMQLFCFDILRVALPALLLGGISAMLVGRKWLSQFTSQVSLGPFIMLLCLIIIVLLVLIVVILNSRRVARANPVKYLRTE